MAPYDGRVNGSVNYRRSDEKIKTHKEIQNIYDIQSIEVYEITLLIVGTTGRRDGRICRLLLCKCSTSV